MDSVINRITLYHNLYIGFLIAAIIFVLFSIFIFIRLDIADVIGFLTGSQAKKEIERLGKEGITKRDKKASDKKQNETEKSHSVKFRHVSDLPQITITRKLEDGTEEKTVLLREEDEQENGTMVLEQSQSEFYTEREILIVHTNEIIE